MHGWHLVTKQQVRALVIELGNFFIGKCLNRKKQQDYIKNTYLQHIKDKKCIKHWLKEDYSLRLLNGIKDEVYSSLKKY